MMSPCWGYACLSGGWYTAHPRHVLYLLLFWCVCVCVCVCLCVCVCWLCSRLNFGPLQYLGSGKVQDSRLQLDWRHTNQLALEQVQGFDAL